MCVYYLCTDWGMSMITVGYPMDKPSDCDEFFHRNESVWLVPGTWEHLLEVE